jgi:hypothetical protein
MRISCRPELRYYMGGLITIAPLHWFYLHLHELIFQDLLFFDSFTNYNGIKLTKEIT